MRWEAAAPVASGKFSTCERASALAVGSALWHALGAFRPSSTWQCFFIVTVSDMLLCAGRHRLAQTDTAQRGALVSGRHTCQRRASMAGPAAVHPQSSLAASARAGKEVDCQGGAARFRCWRQRLSADATRALEAACRALLSGRDRNCWLATRRRRHISQTS